ncbi:MAG: TolB family protein, partial [Blastocatellia bacterium]
MGLITGKTLWRVIVVLLAASPLSAGAERPGLSAALLKKVRAAGVKTVRAPVLSPAGNAMVFVGEFAETWQFVPIRNGTPRTDIWLINKDLTGLRRLTRDGYSDDPSWSPSGGEMAFVDYGSVKVMDLQTGKVRGLRGLKSSKPYT